MYNIKNKAVMKQVLKDLAIVTWWAIRLYAKRAMYVIYYGINYREQFHTWYYHYQEFHNINCIMGFEV